MHMHMPQVSFTCTWGRVRDCSLSPGWLALLRAKEVLTHVASVAELPHGFLGSHRVRRPAQDDEARDVARDDALHPF